jgi:hypothetical protein
MCRDFVSKDFIGLYPYLLLSHHTGRKGSLDEIRKLSLRLF